MKLETSIMSSMPILAKIIDICFVFMSLSFLLCLHRVLFGPTLADRAIASDAVSMNVVGLIAIYSMKQDTDLYLSSVLVIAVLGFIAMVVLSKYIHRGNIVYQMGMPDMPEREKEEVDTE